MGWQNYGDSANSDENDDPAITLGDLRDGEGVSLTVREEPETFESDQYGEGLRVPATFHTSDYTFVTEDGDTIEDGDDVTLITWSRRLGAAFANYANDAGGIVGERVEVQKFGTGMETQYNVTEA